MRWLARVWNVIRSPRLHRDLDREISFHVREKIDDLCASGLNEKEARRQALRTFGNYTIQLEETRDMDINRHVDSALRNMRFAARALSKTPAFAISVVLTLALGIGANSAVFSAIFAVLLKPLPFPQSEQLVSISQVNTKSPSPFISPVRLEEWNRMSASLQALTGYYSQDDSELSGELPEKIRHSFVAPRFLQVWGVAPEIGRDFEPREEHFGGPNAAIISDRLWRRRFGANPNILTLKLRIGTSSIPVVGVMPATFAFPERDVDVWSPSPSDAPFAQSRANTWFTGVARLKPGITVEQARANLATVQASLARRFPMPDADIGVAVEPLRESTVAGLKRSLWLLFGSVSLLLLIACTNVAALLLARMTARSHEVAIRFSLGAKRRDVIGQLLCEVLLLAVGGALLGLTIAAGASRIFQMLGKDSPRVAEIHLDWGVLLYALVCAVAATLICGMMPALRGTRANLSGSLALAGRAQVSGNNRMQMVLASVQVALAVTLLSGAGLLFRSLQELTKVSPGFDANHVLTFHISTSYAEAFQPANNLAMKRVLDGLRSMPGVESASMTIGLPGVPDRYQGEILDAAGSGSPNRPISAFGRWVEPEYFRTLRISLLAGEMCRDGEANCFMVNRSFANSYYGGVQAIGHTLFISGARNPYRIRGIVADVRETGLDRAPGPVFYSCGPGAQPGTTFLIRAHADPMSMVEPVRRRVHELEPLRSVYDLSPLEDHISDAYSQNRLRTVLLAFFAITAISLACVGLYGTLSYMVALRQRETGLRMALGALRGEVLRTFLGRGILIAAAGSITGLMLSAISGRLIRGMLYGVTPGDTLTLGTVIGLVIGVCALASLLPAMRAARLDPMRVLREE